MTDKRVEVLRGIEQLGSISESARANGVSYKAAWQAIETLNNLAGVALLQKSVGGAGGGGAKLTSAGRALLYAADHLANARKTALAELRARGQVGHASMSNIAGIGLRTSMRNQLPCFIRQIDYASGAPRIWLELADGQRLSSRVTRESLELLGLKIDMPVLALCKATAVTIAPTIVTMGEVNVVNSANAANVINLIKGHISKRLGLKQDGQVSLTLGQGLQLAGFTDRSARLKLKQPAMAAIAESAIVIGLAG